MSQTTMTFRTDTAVKEQFSRFCADVGMNATVALNMFMRATVAAQELPFRVRKATAQPPARVNLDLMSREEIVSMLEERDHDTEYRDLDEVLAELGRKYPL